MKSYLTKRLPFFFSYKELKDVEGILLNKISGSPIDKERERVIDSYKKLSKFCDLDFSTDIKTLVDLEPVVRFFISHYSLLEKQALLNVMPVILGCYVSSECLEHGSFDADVPLYNCIIRNKFKNNYLFNQEQESIIIDSLLIAFRCNLEQGVFNSQVSCTLMLIDNNLSLIDIIKGNKNKHSNDEAFSFFNEKLNLSYSNDDSFTNNKLIDSIIKYSYAVHDNDNILPLNPETINIIASNIVKKWDIP